MKISNYKYYGFGSREISRIFISKNKSELFEQIIGIIISLLWWASYLESKVDLGNSLEIYKKVKNSKNIILQKSKLEEVI